MKFKKVKCSKCNSLIDRPAGQSLKSIRLQNNIGLREMARLMNFSPSYICNIEKGKKYCTQKIYEAYAKLEKSTDNQQKEDTNAVSQKSLHKNRRAGRTD